MSSESAGTLVARLQSVGGYAWSLLRNYFPYIATVFTTALYTLPSLGVFIVTYNAITNVVFNKYTRSVDLDEKSSEYLDSWLADHMELVTTDRYRMRRLPDQRNHALKETGIKSSSFNLKRDQAMQPLSLLPYDKTDWWRYRGSWFRLSHADVTEHSSPPTWTITIWGRDPGPVQEFVKNAECHFRSQLDSKTLVFVTRSSSKFDWGFSPWKGLPARDARQLDSVHTDEYFREVVVPEMDWFLQSKTREKCRRLGSPYRRGYLFYGPPGTGKTSAALALAGHFGLDIYCLSLTRVDGDLLTLLLVSISERCIVLIEDADALDTLSDREVTPNNAVPGSYKNNISLSDVLNAIDGVTSTEGRILILTTNYKDNLDAALLRAGRVGRHVEFKQTTSKQAEEMFLRYMEPETPRGLLQESLSDLASKFAAMIPEGRIPPADVEDYLMTQISPEDAVRGAPTWVKKILRETVNGGPMSN